MDELASSEPSRKPIHPQFVAKLVSELAAEDVVFTFDVGEPTIWTARYLKVNGRRRLLGSLAPIAMANALPIAIGAQAADRGRQIVSLSGDGGFTMLMGDFISLVQLNLPVKVVIFDNGALGFVELEMKAASLLDFGVALKDPGELQSALEAAFAHPGLALVDVVTNRAELAMPPKIGVKEAEGFSLWVVKAVLNGRGDEVIELARTNPLSGFFR